MRFQSVVRLVPAKVPIGVSIRRAAGGKPTAPSRNAPIKRSVLICCIPLVPVRGAAIVRHCNPRMAVQQRCAWYSDLASCGSVWRNVNVDTRRLTHEILPSTSDTALRRARPTQSRRARWRALGVECAHQPYDDTMSDAQFLHLILRPICPCSAQQFARLRERRGSVRVRGCGLLYF